MKEEHVEEAEWKDIVGEIEKKKKKKGSTPLDSIIFNWSPWDIISRLPYSEHKHHHPSMEAHRAAAVTHWTPRVTVFDQSSRITVLLDIPGIYCKTDLNIEFEEKEGIICISGERKPCQEASRMKKEGKKKQKGKEKEEAPKEEKKEKKKPKEEELFGEPEEEERCLIGECPMGIFRREISLPYVGGGLDSSKITAAYDCGVLKIVIPKPSVSTRHRVPVTSEF